MCNMLKWLQSFAAIELYRLAINNQEGTKTVKRRLTAF